MAWKQCSILDGFSTSCSIPDKVPRMGYYADKMPGIFVVISYAAAPYCDRESIPKSRADINVCYQKARNAVKRSRIPKIRPFKNSIKPSNCTQKVLFQEVSPCVDECSTDKDTCLRVHDAKECFAKSYSASLLQKHIENYRLCFEESGLEHKKLSNKGIVAGVKATSTDYCGKL